LTLGLGTAFVTPSAQAASILVGPGASPTLGSSDTYTYNSGSGAFTYTYESGGAMPGG
jgi:hypothetical protein